MPETKTYSETQSPIFKGKADENHNPGKKLKLVKTELNQRSGFRKRKPFLGQQENSVKLLWLGLWACQACLNIWGKLPTPSSWVHKELLVNQRVCAHCEVSKWWCCVRIRSLMVGGKWVSWRSISGCPRSRSSCIWHTCPAVWATMERSFGNVWIPAYASATTKLRSCGCRALFTVLRWAEGLGVGSPHLHATSFSISLFYLLIF